MRSRGLQSNYPSSSVCMVGARYNEKALLGIPTFSQSDFRCEICGWIPSRKVRTSLESQAAEHCYFHSVAGDYEKGGEEDGYRK
jgi:hypothetical protein